MRDILRVYYEKKDGDVLFFMRAVLRSFMFVRNGLSDKRVLVRSAVK